MARGKCVSRFSVGFRESCFVQLVSRGESEKEQERGGLANVGRYDRNVFSEEIEIARKMGKVLIEDAKSCELD